jgi:hypothetical protein
MDPAPPPDSNPRQDAPASPLVVVGLPRSGSTLLTRVLNDSPDLFVVNDLYYLQEVDALEAFDGITADKAAKLAGFLMAKLRARSARDEKRGFVASLLLSEESLARIEDDARRLAAGGASWAKLLEGVLAAAAREEGKRIWGYNTPQDFLHLERLERAFPEARFLFLVRHPHATLESYKNVSDDGNDRRRYHPWVQASLWKLCARAYREAAPGREDRLHLVRYEDLVADPAAAIERIGAFLGARIPAPDLDAIGSNSSYRGGGKAPLTDTERWLCDRVAGPFLDELGYVRNGQRRRPRLRDLPMLLWITLRSVGYHAGSALTDRNARARLARGLRSLARRG